MKISEKINTDIKLRGYKNPNDLPLDVHPDLPGGKMGTFSAIFCGLPGSGKTSLYTNLMLHSYGYKKKFHMIYMFNASVHTMPEKFVERLDPSRVYTDLSELDDVLSECLSDENKEYKKLIIIDDLVNDINNKKYIATFKKMLFNRRHYNISIILVTQKLVAIPLFMRNAISHVFFWSFSNKKELQALYDDYIINLDNDEFHELIKYCSSEPHNFLYINVYDGIFYKNFNKLTFEE